MTSGNIFDRLMRRFQHRWETDRQWRAMMSGVLGLLAVLMLCACVGLSGTMFNRVLGPAGLGIVDLGQPAQSDGPPDTGARLVNGVLTFPTPTAVWTVGAVPAVSPIPNSQTPVPTPTPRPTPTPSPTPPPGPGCTVNCGGGPPPSGVTITVTGWTPNRWANGQPASISVHTSVPNDGYGFIMQFPGGTWLSANTDPNLQTDGAGNGTYTFTIPGGYCASGSTVYVKTQVQQGGSLGYGPDTTIPCA